PATEGAGDTAGGPGERRGLCADDEPRRDVPAPRQAYAARPEGGDPRHRVRRLREAPSPRFVSVPEPRQPEGEGGARVVKERAEPAAPYPLSPGIAPEHDGAGARENEHAGPGAESAEIGGLGV